LSFVLGLVDDFFAHSTLVLVTLLGFGQKEPWPGEDISRKGAKTQSAAAFLRVSLRLCAFARKTFSLDPFSELLLVQTFPG
jgi:hypothetical protein